MRFSFNVHIAIDNKIPINVSPTTAALTS